MALSSFSTQQRKKEVEALKRFLGFSFLGSVLFHSLVLLLSTSLFENKPPEQEDKPIELMMIEPTKTPSPETEAKAGSEAAA
ncbi:MAG: energy transducer TonB, partial [Cyanobacteria bacterium SW_7_48_12]